MPISTLSSYYMDCAAESCEITIDTYNGVFEAQLDIDEVEDSLGAYTERGFVNVVYSSFKEWYKNTATPYSKCYLGWHALIGTEFQFKEIIHTIADNVAYNYLVTKDPALLKERSVFGITASGRHLAELPNPLDIYDARNVEACITECVLTTNWIDLVYEQMDRTTHGILGYSTEKMVKDLSQKVRMREQERARSTEKALQKYKKGVISDKQNIHAARRSLNRSIKQYSRFFDKKDIHAFITGDQVLLNGEMFDYKITKTTRILEGSLKTEYFHMPFNLRIINKSGKELASGCVIFKETSLLDQVFGLAIHIQKREREFAFLREMNVFNLTDDFYDDPLNDIKRIARKPPINFDNNDRLYPLFHDHIAELKQPISMEIRPVVKQVLFDRFKRVPLTLLEFMYNPNVTLDQLIANPDEVHNAYARLCLP